MSTKSKRLSDETFTLVTNYYKELFATKTTKKIEEISDEIGICKRSLYTYWNAIGITIEDIGSNYSDFAKLVLIHTELSTRNLYYSERKRIIEEQNKKLRNKRNYEILMRIKEMAELKKARAQLVETLSKVAVKKIR